MWLAKPLTASARSLKALTRYPIHRKPPTYEDLSTEAEILYTGIKVIDLIEPYMQRVVKLVFSVVPV
jgi:F0F1-type ATP synthase beta subunit